MGNMQRFFERNHVYFLTTKTEGGIPIFNTERNCKIILAAIEFFKLILDYKVYAFCIMPNHIHIVIHPYGQYNPAYIMRMLKGNFSRKYNKIYKRQGKTWKRRYYDKVIRNDKMLIRVIEYIHNNPVRAKMVYSPDEYKYSSYNFYAGIENNLNPILEIDRYEG